MSFGQFLDEHGTQAAPVSADLPLISNQDVYLNIALIKQYHENVPKAEARRLAIAGLERLGLGHIANMRNPVLSAEERFCVMLLRAAMVKDAIMIIDRPFKMLPHLKSSEFLVAALKKIDDLYVSCHIYDYAWMEEKYGELCR